MTAFRLVLMDCSRTLQVDDTHQADHPVLNVGDEADLGLDPRQIRLLTA